jgi:hypothetical protein
MQGKRRVPNSAFSSCLVYLLLGIQPTDIRGFQGRQQGILQCENMLKESSKSRPEAKVHPELCILVSLRQ